ncbi:MAG TPA: DUF6089 family protein [Cytophagaceae bacterium]|jgi:hypothetical protein|nr:DUF6089 family protein [Cytophagaceae bacterium]
MIKRLQNMNRLYKLVLLTFLFSLFLVLDTMAQGFNPKNRYWSIGMSMNVMNYVGDVDPGPSFISPGIKGTRYNFGAFVERRIAPRVTLRGGFAVGRIAGSDWQNSSYSLKGGDVYRKARNLSFVNEIFEVKGDVVIDLIEHRGRYQKRPDFVPYVFIGLAYFHHNPQAKVDLGNGTQTYNLRDYHTEGQGLGIAGTPKEYSLNQIALPLGIGLRYKLSKQLDLAFEIGWRFTTTDYLDDDGGVYVDKSALYTAMTAKYGAAKAKDAVLLSDMSWQHVGDANLPQQTITTQVVDANNPSNNFTDVTLAVGGGVSGNRRAKSDNRKDGYIVTGLHLSYIIPTKVICPKFR